MSGKGFYLDSSRCVGCKTCQVACKKKNDLPIGAFYRRVDSYETGSYPTVGLYHISHACNHCEDPACVRNCPTGAMYKDEATGTVQHHDDICIGCRSCIMACPYGAPVFLEDEGIVGKCNACIDTLDEDGEPTCVAACGMRALEFGDFDELKEKHPDAVSEIPCMPSASITNPHVLIEGYDCIYDEQYRELVM